VGLAVGFILGGSVAKVVSSVVQDLIQPVLGLILGVAGGLTSASFNVFGATIRYGNFLATLIDFVVVAGVVYYIVRGFKLDKLDAKKEA